MKFANIYWQNTEIKNGTKRVNIGDNLQFFAIDNLYNKMKIDSKEIVYLKMEELCDYKGEYLILPMNWSLFDLNYMKEDRIAISPYIFPVFLAMTIESATHNDDFFNEHNIAYLKKYEPIGCRDEYTMQKLRDYGVSAYLNGCLTLTFDKRGNGEKQKKTFIVDAPRELEKYMPENIKKNCEILSQQYYYDAEVTEEEVISKIKAQYCKYAEEGALIVTSRLHVASPAVAMGIPVVFARDKIDYRFAWIDKLLPLYERQEYERINWMPDVIECEKIKKQMIGSAIKRIEDSYEKHSYYEISEFFENRETREYVEFQKTIQGNLNRAYEFIASRYAKSDNFYYSIWGATKGAEDFFCYMKEEYPNAELRCVIDLYREEEFHGIKMVKPEQFQLIDNEVVIVLAVKASNMAEEVFGEKKIHPKDYVCVGDLFFEDKK